MGSFVSNHSSCLCSAHCRSENLYSWSSSDGVNYNLDTVWIPQTGSGTTLNAGGNALWLAAWPGNGGVTSYSIQLANVRMWNNVFLVSMSSEALSDLPVLTLGLSAAYSALARVFFSSRCFL